eukprot:GHVT01090495.1.p2 GENE.GHVT01090495.1~~GHVT01090495.1.p2  ORF type:complete len:165 (+),score=11.58 GHVT01090495.1:658-1152(+)
MSNRLSFVDLVSCLRIPFCDGVRWRLVVWLWLNGGEVVIPELPEGVDNAGDAVRGIRDGGQGTGVSSRDANKLWLRNSGKKMKRCCALQQLKQEKERRERKRKLHQAREQREEEEKGLNNLEIEFIRFGDFSVLSGRYLNRRFGGKKTKISTATILKALSLTAT